MKTSVMFIGFVHLLALPAFADTSAVDDWYQNSYAPLWKEAPWDKLEEVLAYYDETLFLHPPDDKMTAVDSREWHV